MALVEYRDRMDFKVHRDFQELSARMDKMEYLALQVFKDVLVPLEMSVKKE